MRSRLPTAVQSGSADRPRVGFATCVQLGLECLEELRDCGAQLDLVLTLPDDRARQKSGRIYLDAFCGRHGIELCKIGGINLPETVAALRDRRLDWVFVIGWSEIVRADTLSAAGKGMVGMHPTLLPLGRGRASIPWAILKGLAETGVTAFVLDEGVDSGPILAQERIPIAEREDATSLYGKVSLAHRHLIRRLWPGLVSDTLRAVPQDESKAEYWPGRKPADGRLAPSMSVRDVDRLVRATTRPYPGAFIEQGGEVLILWKGSVSDELVSPALGVRRVYFRDGCFDAYDFEIREMPGQS